MAEFGLNLAVIVGIDAYENGLPRLQTPTRDARALGRLLAERFGYEVWLRTDGEAGYDELLRLLREELPDRVQHEDARLLFYFAGHGHAQEGDAVEGPVGYFLPYGARRDVSTFLPMRDVFDALKVLPCRHFLAILDCCFAGASFWDSSRDVVAPALKIYQERYSHFLRHPAWQVITSSAHDERALDVPDGRVIGDREEKDLHSPFAQTLLRGLEGQADRYPEGGDGVITTSELYAYLLNSLDAHQTPRSWPLRRHRQGEFVFRDPSRPLELPRAVDLTEEKNPYRGLEPYSRKDSGLFFGRDAEVRNLEAQVERRRLAVVVGPSGSGKSSLVRAGLAPRLELRRDGSWRVPASMRPGADPFESLAKVLAGLGGPKAGDLRDRIGLLREWIAAWLGQDASRHLVLIVDQLEELLTLARPSRADAEGSIPADSGRFLEALAGAVAGEETALDRFHLVLTVRSDFEPALRAGALAEAWGEARFVPRAMTPAELREVVEKPAAERVLFFESSDLVDRLVHEVVQMPGALPLLSFTLSEMYRRYLQSGRGDRTLSAADYEHLGGVLGSLRKRANEEVERLGEDSREVLRNILLRMVDNQTGELTRRRVFLSELKYPRTRDNQRAREILARLSKARLIVEGSAPDPATGDEEPYVEPAHDKLVTAWDQLLVWVREAGEDLALQRRVSQAAGDWLRSERDKDLLWTDDPRLPVLHGEHGLRRRFHHPLRAREPQAPKPWLNQDELDFLAASHQTWQAGQLRLWGTVIVLLAATVGAAWFFYWQNQTNLRLRLSAVVQRLAEQVPVALEENNPDRNSQRALLLARQAYNVNSRRPLGGDLAGRVDEALRQILDRSMPSEVVYRAQDFDPAPLAFSPAGPLLAAGLGAHVVLIDIEKQGARETVLDPETASKAREVGTTAALAFDRDGRLVTGHARGYLCAWTLRSPRKTSSASCRRPLAEDSEVLSVAFHPEKPVLVVSLKDSQGSRLQAWQRDGAELRPLAAVKTAVPVEHLVVGKTGYVFAVAEGSWTLFRWNLDRLEAGAVELAGDTDLAVHSLALRDGERRLLGTTSDLGALYWRTDPMDGPVELLYLESVSALAVDPTSDRFVLSDGGFLYWRGEDYFNLLMAVSIDGADSGPVVLQAYLRDKLRTSLSGTSYCAGAIHDLAFSPDGRLVAASCDRSIRLWRKGGRDWLFEDTPSRITLPQTQGEDALFDPDQPGRLAMARMDGSVDLWDWRRRQARNLAAGGCRRAGDPSPAANRGPAAIANLTWTGGRLNVFEENGDLRTYSFPSSSAPSCVTTPLRTKVCRGALSRDGRWVAAVVEGERGYELALLSSANPSSRKRLDEDGTGVEICPGAVAFHPTDLALAGGVGTALRSWSRDAQGEWRSQELARLDGTIRSVAFSRDGRWLAAGGGVRGTRGYIWLQDRAQPGRPLPLIPVADASVHKVGFSSKGNRLAASDSSGRIQIWDLDHLERDPIVLSGDGELSGPSLSADGTHLAALAETGENSALRVWNLRSSDLADAACRTAAANLSWEDWARFVGADEPYERTCPELPVHPSVLAKGDERAKAGDVKGARALFDRVAEIEPERGLDPVRRIEAVQTREQVLANLRSPLPSLSIALRLFPKADALIREQHVDPIRFQDIVDLCRQGALLGEPGLALPVCDQAVELLDGDVEAHDSRGIARALTGDLSGAAEDFSQALSRPGRDGWVRDLRRGKNPLASPAVLQALAETVR